MGTLKNKKINMDINCVINMHMGTLIEVFCHMGTIWFKKIQYGIKKIQYSHMVCEIN